MNEIKLFFRRIKTPLYKLGLILGIIFLGYQLINNLSALIEQQVFILNGYFLVIGLLLALCITALQIFNFRILLLAMDVHIAYKELMKGFSLSFLPRYIPGTVWGYLSRNEWLYQKHQVQYKVTNIASILEAFVGIFSGLIIVFLSKLKVYSVPTSWLLTFFCVLIIGIISIFLVRKYHTSSFPNYGNLIKIGNVFRFTLTSIAIYIVLWFFLGSFVYFCLRASMASNLDFFKSIALVTNDYFWGWFAGFVTLFVPGGIGVREFVFSNLLASNLSILAAQAYIAGIIARLLLIASEILWVFLGYIMLMRDR